MLRGILYTVIIGFNAFWHPFHISVSDIEHNSDTQSLEISQRIFMDDLETGLKKFHKIDYVDVIKPKDPARLDSLINVYLQKTLLLTIDGKDMKLEYLGSEIEEDARWCYLEVKSVASVKTVEISSLVLFDTFDDQENIVHFKANGKLRSYRLNKREKNTTFNF